MEIPKTPVVGIIGGNGKMGSYFADIFQKAGCKVLISDLNTPLNNIELAEKSDVVIVSVPINQTKKVIKEIAPRINQYSLLADLTSVKEMPVKEMLKCKGEVVGLHPMFGETNPLAGQTIIACPIPGRSEKWYPWIKKVFTAQGAKIEILTPKEHDELMAVIQGLVHFSDIAFSHTLKNLKKPVREYLKYASPAYELKIAFAGRLIAQSPELYADIQLLNPATKKIIALYLKNVKKLFQIEKNSKKKDFIKYFNESAEYLGGYTKAALEDTNYLIYAILNRRKLRGNHHKPLSASKHAEYGALGPKNTFSDLAAAKYIKSLEKNLKEGGKNTIATATNPDTTNKNKKQKICTKHCEGEIAYFHTIKDIFEAIEEGKIQKGIVPLENLLHGTVRETFDCLFDHKVHIAEKFNLPIRHSLVGAPGANRKTIKTISSHIQALSQCKKYIKQHYPNSLISAQPSTMAAYEKILGEKDIRSAAIIPEQVAKNSKGNINILAENIGDSARNRTTFVVIEKGPTPTAHPSKATLPTATETQTAPQKPGTTHSSPPLINPATITHSPPKPSKFETSIAFTFSKDKPGSLSQVFNDFASAKINLSRIESRPSRKEIGNYVFYLDFEGHISEPQNQKIIKKISKKLATLKILGSYEIA